MLKRKTKKETYNSDDVIKLHNRYRIIIIIMLAGFLWIAHKYGISDEIIQDLTGGAVKIKDKQSFWSLILLVGKWLVSSFAIIFGLLMAWQKLIKKKSEEN